MPDILIALHNRSVQLDEFLDLLPDLRRHVEEGLGAQNGAAVVQIFRPSWSQGYDDVDIQVLASPSAISCGRTQVVATNIANMVATHLERRGSTARSIGASVRIFAESAFRVAKVVERFEGP